MYKIFMKEVYDMQLKTVSLAIYMESIAYS
jgi:hypothetical protein